MKKMKHGGKVHKRMQVGGKVMDPSLAAAMAANPANAPVRGAGPISGSQDVGGRGMPIRGGGRMGAGPISGAQDVGGRGMPVRGPKTGVRPSDGKPANPRVTYGPRGPRPKGYGPNDGGPRSMGPRINPVDVTGMPVGGPKTGFNPADGKPNTLGPRGPMPSTNVSYGQPPAGPRGPLPGTVGGAPIGQQAAVQQVGLSAPQTPTKATSLAQLAPMPSTNALKAPPGLTFKKGGAVKSKAMRGGGLARKGVGMALAKGGLARRAGGCAKRGVGRGRMV